MRVKLVIPVLVVIFVTLACSLPGVNDPASPTSIPTVHPLPTLEEIVYPTPAQATLEITRSYVYANVPEDNSVTVVTSTPDSYRMIVPSYYWFYSVRAGDSFWKLAEEFCNDHHEFRFLEQINNLTDESVLTVGQEIRIACQ